MGIVKERVAGVEALLSEARDAGVIVRVVQGKMVVRSWFWQSALVDRLIEREDEVVASLSTGDGALRHEFTADEREKLVALKARLS